MSDPDRTQDLTGKILVNDPNPIGQGGLADLYLGVWNTDKGGTQEVAIKIYRDLSDPPNPKKIKKENLEREIRLFAQLNHENVIKFHGTCGRLTPRPNATALIMLWYREGSLIKFLQGNESKVYRRPLLSQIADGLAYLHSQKIVHGDLKGNNVLVDANGKALLTDFGNSRIVDQEHYSTTLASTAAFMPPELVTDDDSDQPQSGAPGKGSGESNESRGLVINPKSDIWSLGMITLQMFLEKGQKLWGGAQPAKIIIRLSKGLKPKQSDYPSCPLDLWTTLLPCWETDPEDRPSSEDMKAVLRLHQQKALISTDDGTKFDICTKEIAKPDAGELLIKIHSAALSSANWKITHDCLGTSIAGTVEEVGKGVTTFVKGDRVVTQGFFDNEHTALAQFTIQPAEIVAKIPSNVTFDEAASLPAGIATAALALYGSAALTPPWASNHTAEGRPIVIVGGSGAVGQFVIQFAKLSGFSPIITSAPEGNSERLKDLGATHVIGHKADVRSEVREITSSPVSLVYDTISSPTTQAMAWDITAEDGSLILVLEVQVNRGQYPSKKLLSVLGNVCLPRNQALGVALYSALEKYLEQGHIKPTKVEVLPGGLEGLIAGLDKIEDNLFSDVTFVAHSQETA